MGGMIKMYKILITIGTISVVLILMVIQSSDRDPREDEEQMRYITEWRKKHGGENDE